MLLNKIVYVANLVVNNPATDKETFVTYSGFKFQGLNSAAVLVNIQPASPELTVLAEGETFKTFKAFTLASGICEGMLLTASGSGEVYRVRGREVYNYGAGQHYELTLLKSDISKP